ncbi:MAG: autotransporter domain-containing protein [Oscillospiraceae bacterium]|nr:autotransporter domain-containing protein [Oscillospiraceae bacterium]
MLTKGAIGNLLNRYKAVLKKCHLLNTFGSLAVTSMLVLGGTGMAEGVEGTKPENPHVTHSDNTSFTGEQFTNYHYISPKSGSSTVYDFGGIYNNIGTLEFKGCTFSNNSISGTGNNLRPRGGAIGNQSGTVTIIGGSFTENFAKHGTSDTWYTEGGGGAIYSNAKLYINCKVNNLGEIEFFDTYQDKNGNTLDSKVTFSNNKAQGGGALFIGNDFRAYNVIFNGNKTLGWGGGGAIKFAHAGTFNLTNAKFIDNKAESGNGGAIYAHVGTKLTIKDSIFTENTASYGGAIYNKIALIFEGENIFSKNKTGSTPNDIYNYSTGTINVKAGATLSMDGGIKGSGKLTFESGSTLLVEDASKLNDRTTPLISDGTLTVDSGAKLKLNKAVSGETYRIADNLTSGSYWTSDNIILTSLLLEGEAKVDTDQKGFTVKVSTAADGDIAAALPGVIPVLGLSESVDSGIDTGSDFMGRRFLSRATDTDYLPVKAAEPAKADDTQNGTATAVKLINEVARAAVTVGVQNTALRISDAAADLNLDHLSLANHDKASSFHSGGSDFWAAPLYGNLYSSGMTLNSDSVRGQFGGLALGADTEIGQLAGGKVRLGAALHGGGGQSETKGTLTTSQNDYDFGGLSFYTGWNKGAFNLIGSLGYGFGNHEVEMALPSSIDMGTAKADIDTTAFTTDLRAEYELKAGWLNVVPHIGLRYTMLKTDAHELSVPGGVMTEFAADTQNIVQFPIGVALSADTTFGGWTVKPGADFSFIPACGETDAYTRMHFTGVDAWDSVNSRIMDSTSYAAELSLKAEKGNFSLGLSYGVQASSHETDQNIQFKLGWKF